MAIVGHRQRCTSIELILDISQTLLVRNKIDILVRFKVCTSLSIRTLRSTSVAPLRFGTVWRYEL